MITRKKVVGLILIIFAAAVTIMLYTYYVQGSLNEGWGIFELCRPNVVGKNLANFSTNYLLFMDNGGNNTNVNIYDPVKDAVEINAQNAYMHAMRDGSGGNRLGYTYSKKYTEINALLGGGGDSSVNFKREILISAKQDLEQARALKDTHLRSIVALKMTSFDDQPTCVGGFNVHPLNSNNQLKPQETFHYIKSIMVRHLQEKIDALPR